MSIHIKGGMVLNDRFVFEQTDVLTVKGKIEKIGAVNEVAETIDAKDCYVIPGFVDVHMHGAMGKTFIDFDADTHEKIASFEAKNGTTSLVPALSAAPRQKLIFSITQLRACCENTKENCAAIRGIHAEGPFFAEKYKGAHLPENIRHPEIDEFTEMMNAAGGYLKIITMAPELPGADDVILKAREKGITVSVGHTDADYETVKHAIELGAKQCTHLFNAMRPVNHRDPGTAGAFLICDAKCELICDFVHVHPDMVRLVYDIKGKDGINMITDSELATGMPDGDYHVNGRVLTVKNKETRTEDGALAGGSTCLLDCVKNMVSIGIPLEEACQMATKNPAQSAGIYDVCGSITVGKDADILILDKKLNLRHVILRGNIVI